jgi:membrane protein implicated in regulation of membrane protease activity
VIETIQPSARAGRVKIGGEDWRAVTDDESNLEVGRKVRIKGIDGNKVVVERIGEEDVMPPQK